MLSILNELQKHYDLVIYLIIGVIFIFFLSFFFYVLNFIEFSIDVSLYFRNKKLDEIADRERETANV